MRAALVDVDGTLVDSNYHHAIAWSRGFQEHGHRVKLAAIHRLIGMGGTDLMERLIGEPDDAVEASWRKHFDELLPEVGALGGAADLLRGLKERGVTVVLATSSPEDLLGALRDKFGADDAIDAVVTAGDVDGAKPRPDIFDCALEKAGVDAAEAAVIGDSVWDVEAAKRAGVRCIGLETGGFSRAELEAAGAAAVYEDPLDLLAHLDQEAAGS
jgi:HAD superfamily hydrolase (TIGR01509 family)